MEKKKAASVGSTCGFRFIEPAERAFRQSRRGRKRPAVAEEPVRAVSVRRPSSSRRRWHCQPSSLRLHLRQSTRSRQENLFHFSGITKNPRAFACGFVSFGHVEAPISGAAESNREPTALSIPCYFSTFSSRESAISKSFATALSLCIRKVFCPSDNFCSITLGEVKQQ